MADSGGREKRQKPDIPMLCREDTGLVDNKTQTLFLYRGLCLLRRHRWLW